MHAPHSPALPRDLPGGYVLDRARGPEDLEAVVASHMAAFGDEDEGALRHNLLGRPGARPEDVLLVREASGGRPVSSVSMFRQRWLYEGVALPVAEVGIVSTLAEHRGKGLVREQFREYHRMALRAGAVLSIIAGIPHFYRQFGYEYCLPMEGGVSLRPDQVPEATGEDGYRVRPSAPDDWPLLTTLYAREVRGLGVAADLDVAVWRYQDALPEESNDRQATYVVERGGSPVGFVRIAPRPDPEGKRPLRVRMAHLACREDCLAALRWLARVAREEHGGRDVHVQIGRDAPLVLTALDLGGERKRPYGWLVRMLDPARLLFLIGPALERRLAESPWCGHSEEMAINLMTETVVLRFREGRLLGVATTTGRDRRHLRLPPHVAPMLWLGARSIAELLEWYPDVSVRGAEVHRLVDTLFPRRESWVCSLF